MSVMTSAVALHGSASDGRNTRREGTTVEGRTELVATVRVLRTLGGVRDAPEGLLEPRVEDEGAGVVGVGLVHGAVCRGGSGACLAARLVTIGHANTDADADTNDHNEGEETTDELEFRALRRHARNELGDRKSN